MTKKIVFICGIITPIILGFVYDAMFGYSGNWLEDYQNHFKIGFILISIVNSLLLSIVLKNEKRYILMLLTILVLIALLIFLFFAVAIINFHF